MVCCPNRGPPADVLPGVADSLGLGERTRPTGVEHSEMAKSADSRKFRICAHDCGVLAQPPKTLHDSMRFWFLFVTYELGKAFFEFGNL